MQWHFWYFSNNLSPEKDSHYKLQRRFSEHMSRGPVKTHMESCNVTIDHRNIDIIVSTTRGEKSLLTLEALHQRTLNPSINTKDEYKSRTLTIKF